jgi:hypothetical protein
MTRTVLLAMVLVVVRPTSAFAPNHTATATATFLFPEQDRQLVAFSHDHLSRKAKASAIRASNLPSPRRQQQARRILSSPPRGARAAGVASAAKSFVTRLLGHVDGGSARCRMETLEEELMNAYSKDLICHPEDELLFRQIVD